MMLCCVARASLASFYPTMQHYTPVEFISKFATLGTSNLLTYLYYSVLAVFKNKLIYRHVYFPSDTYFNASSDQFTLSQPVSIGWVFRHLTFIFVQGYLPPYCCGCCKDAGGCCACGQPCCCWYSDPVPASLYAGSCWLSAAEFTTCEGICWFTFMC